ncbi:MAG: hypothetical protein AAF125_18980, partial [Chloroflexota bacterium]
MAITDSAGAAQQPTEAESGRGLSPTAGFLLRFFGVAALTGAIMHFSNVNIGSIGQGLALSLVGVGVYI